MGFRLTEMYVGEDHTAPSMGLHDRFVCLGLVFHHCTTRESQLFEFGLSPLSDEDDKQQGSTVDSAGHVGGIITGVLYCLRLRRKGLLL